MQTLVDAVFSWFIWTKGRTFVHSVMNIQWITSRVVRGWMNNLAFQMVIGLLTSLFPFRFIFIFFVKLVWFFYLEGGYQNNHFFFVSIYSTHLLVRSCTTRSVLIISLCLKTVVYIQVHVCLKVVSERAMSACYEYL